MRPDGPLVGPSPRRVVEVRGEDRVSYLDNVLSQRLAEGEPGIVRGALVLEVHGSPTAMFDVVVLEDRLLLITPGEEVARGVVDTLGARTFLADARFDVRDERVLLLRGQGSHAVAAEAGLDAGPGAAAEHDGALAVGRAEGVDLVAAGDALEDARQRLVERGATAVTAEELEAWRVAAGEPAWGSEVRAPHLPEELGLLPTHVHLDKGCYPGQEAVARMWMLGRPRRRLAAVDLEGSAGAGWRAGSGRAAVEVTSATSYAGARVGLAFVPADAAPGDRYGDDGGAVVVRALVGQGLPVPGHNPAMTRRRDRRG